MAGGSILYREVRDGRRRSGALRALCTRNHHSSSEAHFGKNYGGVLLVWDRLFGTYAAVEPVESFGEV